MRCRRYEGADCHVEAVLSALWFIYHLFRKQGCPPQVQALRRCGRRGRTGNLDAETQESDLWGLPGVGGAGAGCICGESLSGAFIVRRCLVRESLPSLTPTRCGQPAGGFLLADSRCLLCWMIHSCQRIKCVLIYFINREFRKKETWLLLLFFLNQRIW